MTRASPEADDARTANLLGAYALRAAGAMEETLAASSGLGGSDHAALLALANFAEGENLDTLRRALGLSQPGTVHVLDRLVARGLAERMRAEQDRREVRARLTARGRGLAHQLRHAREAALSADLGALTPGERPVLAALLEKLLAAATDGRETARRLCRLCDADVCGHPERCPVTLAADRATGSRG